MTTVVLSISAILLVWAPRLLAALKPCVVLAWNTLFVLSLVLTILADQVKFPADPSAYPLAEPTVAPLHNVFLVLTLVLFPVILVDFALFTQYLGDRRPSTHRVGGAFVLASLFFMLTIFAHIFTTTYAYIPAVGPFFRDKFWLVYLIAGIALTLPVLLVRRSSFNIGQAAGDLKIGPLFPGLILLINLTTIVGAFLTASKPVSPSDAQTTLRILTYNIQQGYNTEGLKNFDGQLDLIRQIDADIIGLQESDTNRIAGGNSDVVRFFADRLNMYSYYSPKIVVGTFGIALLSKVPITGPRTFYMYSSELHDHDLVDLEQTATIEAQIVVGERTFHVFVTHLGNDGPIVQQKAILEKVQGKEDVILLGDFNFGPDAAQYRLTTELLDDSWALRWPDVDKRSVDFKGEGIDHIFVSPRTSITDARYLPDLESDHPATTADIEW
jgi:endonuclease/exonuclease/phosphatase family metal-dependent hydrolase